MKSPGRFKLIAIANVALLLSVCLAGAILACYACFSTPSMSTSLYTLQLDMSQVNLSLVFPPYPGYSTREDVLANYSFENSGLSPVYRIGLFGYCGGEIVNGEFKKDHCIKNDAAYQLNPWVTLKDEINTNMTMQFNQMSEDLVVLPDSLPSKQTMKRKSLDMYGGTMAGMGLALWCAISCLILVLGMVVEIATSGNEWFTMLALGNFMLCVFWAFGSFIALAAGAGGAQPTYKNVAKAFNNESGVYGITATSGNFFGLIYGAMALELVFVVLMIIVGVFLRRPKNGTSKTTPAHHPNPSEEVYSTQEPEKQRSEEQTNISGGSQSAPAVLADLPPPTYEESQNHVLLGFFGLER